VRNVVRLICIVFLGLGGSVLVAGVAYAATAPGSSLGPRGLGAALPKQRLAPRVVALDADPASVDLRAWAVPPGDQGQVGSCVTWAIDYALLGWYSRYSSVIGQPFAPMYTYSQINGGVDGGAIPTDALRVAATQGSDTRVHYTQGDYDWSHQPTAAERANAAHFKIKGYTTLFAGAGQAGATTSVKHALATKHPVAIEMAVRHGFDYLGASESAVDGDVTSPIRGYHEVLAVGYDSAGVIVQNSWGATWAGDGFGRISWQVVQHDVWEADTIEGFVTPPPPVPRTPPTTTAPTVAKVAENVTAGAPTAKVSYKIAWSGKVGTTGAITRYDVWSQVDGKAFVRVALATAKSTSFTLAAIVGHHYRIAVRAATSTTTGALRYSDNFLASR
jgi:hypothetical protein